MKEREKQTEREAGTEHANISIPIFPSGGWGGGDGCSSIDIHFMYNIHRVGSLKSLRTALAACKTGADQQLGVT